MLCERNLVGILRVSVVAVDGLGAVGVFRRGNDFSVIAGGLGRLRLLGRRLRLSLLLEGLRLGVGHG